MSDFQNALLSLSETEGALFLLLVEISQVEPQI